MYEKNSKTDTAEVAETQKKRSKRERRHSKVALALMLCVLLVAAQIAGAFPALASGGEEQTAASYQVDASTIETPATEQSAADLQATLTQEASAPADTASATSPEEEDADASGGSDATSPEEDDDGGIVTDDAAEDAALNALGIGETEESEELDALADSDITTQEELQEALDAVAEGGTVTLTHDIVIGAGGQALVLPQRSFTLNGAEKSLTLAAGYSGAHISAVYNSGVYPSVIVCDLSFVGHNSGAATAGNYATRAVGGGFIFRGASLDRTHLFLTGCSFSGIHGTASSGDAGRGALRPQNASVHLSGCSFTGNSSNDGAAVCMNTNTTALDADACTFTNNYAATRGGVLSASGGGSTYAFTSCTFTGNSAQFGGVFDMERGSHRLVATNCVFESNSATTGDGGVLYSYNTGSQEFTSCTFTNNLAGRDGGALRVTALTLTNCDFDSNQAGGSGGAVSRSNNARTVVSGGSFTNNQAGTNGGAIDGNALFFMDSYAKEESQLVIDGTAFSGNSAGNGYHYIDFDRPIDSALYPYDPFWIELFQSEAGPLYDTIFTNIQGSSSASGEPESQLILNNYDLESFSHAVYIMTDPDDGATWSDGNTSSQRYWEPRYTTTIEGYFEDIGITLEREGYVIAGWLVDKSYLPGYANEGEYIDVRYNLLPNDYYMHGEIILLPYWAEAVSLTYHFNNETSAETHADGTEVAVKNPAEVDVTWVDGEKSVFIGWATAETPVEGEALYGPDTPNSTLTVTADTDLYARFAPLSLSYTVDFESNGGSAVPSQEVPENGFVTEPADPTRDDYVFNGWYANSGLTSAWDFTTPVTSDLTLYAKWTALHDVTFNSNGGSAVASQEVLDGTLAARPADPTRSGYTFSGWYSNSSFTTAWSFTTPVTGNLVLFAKWTEIPPVPPTVTYYTVTYQPGTRGVFAAQSSTVVAGSATPAAPVITGQAGWRFTGWYPTPSATVTGNATYTAQWAMIVQPVDVFTVTFVDWNGTLLKSEQVSRGGSATPPVNPVREGYTFDGWNGSYVNVNVNITITAQYLIEQPATTVTTTPPPVTPQAPPATPTPAEPTAHDVVQLLTEDHGVPAVNIGGLDIPLSAGPFSHLVWALVNLVLASIGIILMLVAALVVVSRKTRKRASQSKRTAYIWLAATSVVAVAGLVVFFLTQDMSLPLVLTDSWTVLNAILLVLEVVGMVLALRYAKTTDKTTDDEASDQYVAGEVG